jgi:hypothetical protein
LEVVTVEPDTHELELELEEAPEVGLPEPPPSRDAMKEVIAKFTILDGSASD